MKFSAISEDIRKSMDFSTEDCLEAELLATISALLVKKRMEMGATQKEFAKKIGVSQSTLSKYEQASYNFSIRKLAEIFSAIDLHIKLDVSNTCDVLQMLTKERVDRSWGQSFFGSSRRDKLA